MTGPLNMAQITLACGLGMEARNPDFRFARPKLRAWFDAFAKRRSFLETAATPAR
jgi:hypothetical protein